MFNPLTPSEMVSAIGLAARATARSESELDDFDRGQLMSAYSATRHLAIEIASFSAELRDRSHLPYCRHYIYNLTGKRLMVY